MNNYFRIFTTIFLIFSTFSDARVTYENYSKLSDKILGACSKRLESRYPLTVMGTGGSTAYDIRQMGISYNYNGIMELAEVRTIYITICEEIIAAFNSNKELRPFLHNFPFNEKNLGISINFNDANGDNSRDGKVATVLSGFTDVIYYRSMNKDLNDIRTDEFYRETYKEALEIVRKEQRCQEKQKNKGSNL